MVDVLPFPMEPVCLERVRRFEPLGASVAWIVYLCTVSVDRTENNVVVVVHKRLVT